MGAGVSVVGLPISLDKEAARAAAGGQFDEAKFDDAAVNGMVSRDAFATAVQQHDARSQAQPSSSPEKAGGQKRKDCWSGAGRSWLRR